MSGRRAARAPLLLGLGLGLASHPAWAGRLVPGRALGIGRLSELALNHALLAGSGFALVASLGLGLGLLATRAGGLRAGIDAAAALAQSVPPVVVVALALPVLGFGGPPTLLALVAYAIMPTVRGTVGAFDAVSPDAVEAARALGLTPWQVLTRVELPLAAPGLLDTMRTALVLSVATAAVGALAGASTLGTPVVAGLQNQAPLPMLQGAAATAALAFLADAALLGLSGLAVRAAGGPATDRH